MDAKALVKTDKNCGISKTVTEDMNQMQLEKPTLKQSTLVISDIKSMKRNITNNIIGFHDSESCRIELLRYWHVI